ncbi:MAG: DUF1269 domain-containing protein [Anaerolineae bacterium]
MSDVVVVVFDDLEEARKARDAVRQVQKENALSLDDAAVIVKDASGKVHMDGEMDRGVKIGAGAGALLGLLVFFLFPISGLILGAAGGALVGKLMGNHVDKKFAKEVSDSLKPGGSALFLIIRSGSPAALRGALEPYKGQLYQTTLSEDAEAQLAKALE